MAYEEQLGIMDRMSQNDVPQGRNAMTVTQLNEYIKMLVESSNPLADVWLKGEISNFTNHRTGHFYFTLKDEGSLIKAVMFKSSAGKLKFLPENGMKVIVHGRVSVFVRDGQYQIYVDAMEPDGVGALYVAFEQLKRKLESEGLFAPDRKKPLPKIPSRVGIITSPTGAAVRDMINISGRRFPFAKLILYPSLVQGESAASQLCAGIRYFNETNSVDVIIIGRGGGSIEDLWAFNDEALARTVAASRIPVISAVGHETDFTICDFAADKRAPTPSAAAELALPETGELKRKINNIIGRETVLLSRILENYRTLLKRYSASRTLTSPKNIIDDKRMLLVSLAERLNMDAERIHLNNRAALSTLAAKLDALSPMAVLARGYGAAYGTDGSLVKSVKDVSEGDELKLQVADGMIYSRVTSSEETDHE